MFRTCISIRTLQIAVLAGVCFAGTTAFAQSKGKGLVSKLRPTTTKQVVQKAKLPASTLAQGAYADDVAYPIPGPGPAPRGVQGACLLPAGAGCIIVGTAAECTGVFFGTYMGAGSACPVVDCGFAISQTNCQDYQYPRVGGTSLASMGTPNTSLFRVADSFKTGNGAGNYNVTEVCWWGVYSQRVGAAFSCALPSGDQPFTDRFFVRIMAMTGQLPDVTQVVGEREEGLNMTVTRRPVCANNLAFNEYHGTFATGQGIQLQPGTCYALEIRNPNNNVVNWFWGHAGVVVDNISWQDTTENGYSTTEVGTAGAGDRAWCMNINLNIFQTGGACSTPPPPICASPDANGQVRAGINGGGFSNTGATAVGLQLGDSFQFSSSGNIDNVCFWGFWVAPDGTQPPGPDVPDFQLTIYDSNGTDALPNTVLRDGTCGTTAGFTSRRQGANYNIAFPALAVDAGHCYYVSIAFPQNNADPAHAFRFAWGLAAEAPANAMSNAQCISRAGTSAPGGTYNFFTFGTDPAFPSNMSWVFNLQAVTPSCGLPPPPPPPPANDPCGSAAVAVLGNNPFDTRGATQDGFDPSCGPTGKDAWFTFRAPCAGDYTISFCAGAILDVLASAYSDGCPGTIEIGCDDDGCGVVGGPSIFTVAGLAQNQQILIRVSTFADSAGEAGTFNISRAGGPCPSGCACDFNHNGTLNSQDFFDFLTAFLTTPLPLPTADYNGDGVINSQDYFDFLLCFLASPPAPGC